MARVGLIGSVLVGVGALAGVPGSIGANSEAQTTDSQNPLYADLDCTGEWIRDTTFDYGDDDVALKGGAAGTPREALASGLNEFPSAPSVGEFEEAPSQESDRRFDLLKDDRLLVSATVTEVASTWQLRSLTGCDDTLTGK